MNSIMCRICGHESRHHRKSGCQFTTCSCIAFEEEKLIKQEEKRESSQKSPTQNIREKLDQWDVNTKAFKKTPSSKVKQESTQDRQTSQSGRWDEVEANWKKIDDFTNNNEYEKVDKELDIILGKNFENISAWIKRGHNNNKLSRFKEAIVCYESALILDNKEDNKLYKKNYEILNNIAITHKNNGNHKEAINFCKESLKIKEDFIDALFELAYNYREIGEFELAVEQFLILLKVERNNVDALDNLGHNYEKLKKWDQAMECYKISRDVEEKDPKDVYADKHLAACYFNKGNFEQAEVLINIEKIRENEDAYSYEIRGLICKKLQKYEEAIKNYEKELTFELEGRYGVLFDLGFCYQQIGNTVISLAHYKKYAEVEFTRSVAQNIGFGLRSIGDEEEAMKWYDKGLKEYPEAKGILKNKGSLCEKLDQYEDAIKCYDKILENEPDDLWILSYKANALINIQKNIEAREIFKIIQAANRTKDDPSEERILNDMGWSYIENKEFVTGLKYAEDALKINSTEGYILDTKCEALRKLKRYGEAKECYEEKYKITKDETDRIWIGICLLRLGNQEDDVEEKQKYYKDSIEIFNLVIEKDPTNPYGWYNKACTNEVLKKYGEAKKNVFEAIKHNQNVDIFWDELAKICSKEKNNEQAIMYYDVSLGIIADSTIFYKKANILYELGRYKEAITCYDKALEIKFSIDTIIAKGDALHMSLNYKEAITCYDKAIEKDPEHERAFSNKGNTLRGMRKYKESLECLKRAIEIDPTDFYNVGMQSQTYREWGKYEKALEINEQMLKKFPDDKESIYQSFIEIYQGMNDQNKVEEYKEKLQKLRDLK